MPAKKPRALRKARMIRFRVTEATFSQLCDLSETYGAYGVTGPHECARTIVLLHLTELGRSRRKPG